MQRQLEWQEPQLFACCWHLEAPKLEKAETSHWKNWFSLSVLVICEWQIWWDYICVVFPLPIAMDHFQRSTEEPRCSWVHRWTSRRLHASRASSLWMVPGPWKGRVFSFWKMPSSSPLQRCTLLTATTWPKMQMTRLVVRSASVAISLSGAISAFTTAARRMVEPRAWSMCEPFLLIVDGESVLVFQVVKMLVLWLVKWLLEPDMLWHCW